MKYPVVFVIGVSKDSELHIHTFLLFQPCPEVFTKNWDPVVSGIEAVLFCLFFESYMFLELPDCSKGYVKELKAKEAKCPFELVIKSQSNSKSSKTSQNNDVNNNVL